MKTYNSYEEAKIANPQSTIYKGCSVKAFFTCKGIDPVGLPLQPANPADHCMTNNEFIEKGYRIVIGDIVLDDKRVVIVSDCAKIGRAHV